MSRSRHHVLTLYIDHLLFKHEIGMQAFLLAFLVAVGMREYDDTKCYYLYGFNIYVC